MKDIKMKKRELFPIIHFLLSFILERFILIFDTGMEVVQTIPRNNIISDVGEKVMGYVIAKLFALAMIFFIWHLIFFLVDNWKQKKNLRFFTVLFAIGAVLVILFWPYWFYYHSTDNLITYSYAIRCLPEYWHSAYTSLVYTAEMMVIPSAVFITLFQWLFAVFDISYIYNRINDSRVLNGKGKNWVFLIFLMPQILSLFFDSYRTEIYTLLCVYVVSKAVMDIVDGVEGDKFDLIRDILLCGFIAVWRTEGIVLGILLFAVKLLFVYRYKHKKSILVFLCVILSFALFLAPQKLGDKKYYGKDYTFINSLPVLRNILASPNANLAYDGVAEDLAALERVTPVEIIRYYGMDGYRRYNYSQGRLDINQSMVSDEVAGAYNKAYLNLVLHNLPIYARTQIGMVLRALQITDSEYVIYYPESPVNDLPPWELAAWEVGRADVNATHFYGKWQESKCFMTAEKGLSNFESTVGKLGKKSMVHPLINVFLILTNIYIALSELIKLIKRHENKFGIGLISVILLGQFAAIALVMPAGALAYLHTYYFCSFAVFLVWMAFFTKERKNK